MLYDVLVVLVVTLFFTLELLHYIAGARLEASLRDLLTRKLQGINRSSVRVLAEDRWVKQILHVLAVDAASAALVERVWASLDAATRADTIVVLTTTRGGGFIYCNPDPPLGTECPPIGG